MEQEESGQKQRTVRNETSMVLTGLEGNSLYLITVKGFNSIGQGPATAAVTAKTRKAREYSADTNHVMLNIVWRLPVKFALIPLIKSVVIDLVGLKKSCLKVLLNLDPERRILSSAPAHPPSNLMWIQEGNNVSLSWDPVKAKDNESDVIGYMVMIAFSSSFIS